MISNGLADKTKGENRGFSLVELVICVAILAVATIPLMSAFSTSGRVIGKAQSLQNATSVAESVMEEIKGSSIEAIKNNSDYSFVVDDAITYPTFAGYTDSAKITYGNGKVGSSKGVLVQQKDASFYVFYKPDVKSDAEEGSINGEKYDVVATIDASTSYNTSSDDTTPADANSIELPVIERIDKGKHAVISKEINRLDSSAVETWKNNYRDKMHLSSTDSVTLAGLTKEVIITIDDPETGDDPSSHKADIECMVRYYDSSMSSFDADDCHVAEKVYSGTFLGAVDTKAYVFYETAIQCIHRNNVKNSLTNPEIIKKEDIIIKNTSSGGYARKKPRQVYLILREDDYYSTGDSNYLMLAAGNTHITVEAADASSGTKVSDNSQAALRKDGVIESPDKNLMVITNLPKSMGENSHFYYNEKDDYIYEIEVHVFDKSGNEKAHLKSTKDAERTPTPTPLPTTTTVPGS